MKRYSNTNSVQADKQGFAHKYKLEDFELNKIEIINGYISYLKKQKEAL
jgi:hypothetical protein